MSKMIFNKIPEKWEEYLPLGNGRLGCMVKTHPCNEVIQLNEEGIWSGGPQNRSNPYTKNAINKIRELVKEGKVLAAQSAAFENMSGMGFNQRVYQTAGDFKIDFFNDKNEGLECGWPLCHKADDGAVKSYKSELNLDDACVITTYTDCNGVVFTRKIWASAVDDVIFMHVTASKPGQINFSGYLDRGIWEDRLFSDSENNMIFLEDAHGIPFCAGVGAVANGGSVCTSGFTLAGHSCDEVLFFIDIQSWHWNGKNIDAAGYEKAIKKNTWSGLCKNHLLNIKNFVESHGVGVAAEDYFGWHLVEYKGYWDRFELGFGEKCDVCAAGDAGDTCDGVVLSKLQNSTPELLKAASEDNVELVKLYADFGRYLLISGSRTPGVLPLTLQGLWNCYMDPPWGSKYTININAQMNYWPVNMAALSECELPFFELLERSYEKGCRVAQEMYGCRGFVLHHNTDFWGDAAPQDSWLPGTYWVLGAAWMATHIFEHYEYCMDLSFLSRYYYLMHEACRFFVDFLQPCSLLADDGKPYLVINPSVSPENSYVTKAGQVGAFTEGCEMDNMILEHLFKSCVRAWKILGKKACDKNGRRYADADEAAQFQYVLNHLKKPELNSDGSLMEWNTEVPEVEPGHRHISHLYGLYPGHTISVEKTPELAGACKKTLTKRLSNGGGHTGWSQSWIINFRAQLEQGNEALEGLVKLFKNSTLPNLLDNHPPFQIDGNFGSLAGILRMLVQSDFNDDGTVTVKLLPALPSNAAWQCGFIRGAGIKGGYFIDFEWKDGKVTGFELKAGNHCIEKEKIMIC